MSVNEWGENYEQVIQNGSWMKVGDDMKLRFWEDKWVGNNVLKK